MTPRLEGRIKTYKILTTHKSQRGSTVNQFAGNGQGDQCTHHEHPGQHVHARVGGFGDLFQPSHHIGRDKTSQVAIELIAAIPAAAAAPPKNEVGRLQNKGMAETMPMQAQISAMNE